jgi:hypothetical protein
MPEENGKQAAPYLPFKTFMGALDQFNHGVPPLIDRGIWRTQPGGTQGLIMGALRFFDLIDDSNRPTTLLHRVVATKDNRPAAIRVMLETSYSALLTHDISKMTAKMLEDGIEQYGVSGETRKKAVTFFLQAAKYADMPLSPFLQSQIRATPGNRKRRAIRKDYDESVDSQSSMPSIPAVADGNTKTVDLQGGGRVSVTVSLNPFNLAKADREFVFALIDKLSDYEQQGLLEDRLKVEKL